MPAMTTLITPAENRFFLLSERARRTTTLQQISGLLRDHVTVKVTSDFLLDTVRNLILHDHAAWMTACSHEWQLLASLPYVINPSDDRHNWHHCELCHKPVRYEYHVQNKHNQQALVVGSECVKKFMNAETRYLMVITTEDNFYAVAQYQTLTAQVPVIPTIMFKQPWLPQLPSDQHAQAKQLRTMTSQTVTTYLKRRTTTLPLLALKPALKDYDQLVQLEAKTVATQAVVKEAQAVATQQQRTKAVQRTVQSAVEKLKTSPLYRQYLHQLAVIIVSRPDRATAKTLFSKLTPPATTRPLVNSYQFGLMVTEYQQIGQIQVRRLAMLDRDFVQALNQVTRQLDQRQTIRFYDDVYNSCWGWTYHQAANQRADWQRLLATRFGTDLSLAWFQELTQQTDATVVAWLAKHADTIMQTQLKQRLKTAGPIARSRLTRSELREFCQRELTASATAVDFQRAFDRYYQLPAERQTQWHETLAYYYVAKHSTADHQVALQQLQWLLRQ
ncbi:hypothetical protein C5Z26_08715 [Lactobacillus sp. CBA3606]|uniref:hypothetical protein n=1 Tax=Lactobacillus sp. CBA3606 TaxID=2099789 RepID=UPI000CFBF332|nr:hypothetical protein [Lactobacillus sp. CBA3606]AVK64188.1 hypothetical protein C5Z26_08715 [Lactobacillus sp. CBA3606]